MRCFICTLNLDMIGKCVHWLESYACEYNDAVVVLFSPQSAAVFPFALRNGNCGSNNDTEPRMVDFWLSLNFDVILRDFVCAAVVPFLVFR